MGTWAPPCAGLSAPFTRVCGPFPRANHPPTQGRCVEYGLLAGIMDNGSSRQLGRPESCAESSARRHVNTAAQAEREGEPVSQISPPEPPNGVEYDASAIQVLEGLEAVRKRPGMYIGSTGERGLHHLIWEIVDNAVDEALAGYCDRIVITLGDDGSIKVEDNGRGIPTDTAPGQELPAVTIALTQLHAGGKFGGGGYKVSGGLHGVGVSVVNALSTKLVVDVRNRGHLYRQTFGLGEPDGPLEELRPLEDGEGTGTTVTYWASPDIFETTSYSLETITTRIRE